MLEKIQKIDITYRLWKLDKLKELNEAIIILTYVIRTGKFPHGEVEYAEILNREV